MLKGERNADDVKLKLIATKQKTRHFRSTNGFAMDFYMSVVVFSILLSLFLSFLSFGWLDGNEIIGVHDPVIFM